MRLRKTLSLASTVFLLGGAASARAQSYSIDWQSLDAGGGTSVAGGYSVSGVIGQPDAGRMSGGVYAVEGGFLSVAVDPEKPITPVWLHISVTTTNTVLVAWPASATGLVLRQKADVEPGTWLEVPVVPTVVADEYQMVIAPAAGNVFYRLEKK